MNRHSLQIGGANWLLFITVALQLFLTYFIIVLHSFFSFEKPNQYLVLTITQICTIFLPSLFYTLSKKIEDYPSFFRLHKIPISNLGLLIGLGICGQFIGQLLNLLFLLLLKPFGWGTLSEPIVIEHSTRGFLLAFLLIALFPAVFEEFLMRGIVLRSYEKRGTKTAILITSILFGIMHLDIQNLPATIFMGWLIAYCTVQTNSLWAAILVHFINNAFAVLSYFIADTGQQWVVWGWLIGVIVSFIAFFPLLRVFRKKNPDAVWIPSRHSFLTELVRTIFSLPIMLILAAFVVIHFYLLGIL